MISLFLDTSSSYLHIALVKNDILIKEIYTKLDKDLSKMALSNIKNLLDEFNLLPNDIDEIVCVKGPGSFTGLRVSATIAKTFCHFLNKKLYSVSRLYVMATSSKNDYIVPIIDARRGYVYGAIYDSNYNTVLEESYITLKDLQEKVKKLNNAVYISLDTFDNIDVIPYNPNINNLYKNIKKQEENPITFVPNYLKRPEAEEKLNDKRN